MLLKLQPLQSMVWVTSKEDMFSPVVPAGWARNNYGGHVTNDIPPFRFAPLC